MEFPLFRALIPQYIKIKSLINIKSIDLIDYNHEFFFFEIELLTCLLDLEVYAFLAIQIGAIAITDSTLFEHF